jgi:hypothetical protein
MDLLAETPDYPAPESKLHPSNSTVPYDYGSRQARPLFELKSSFLKVPKEFKWLEKEMNRLSKESDWCTTHGVVIGNIMNDGSEEVDEEVETTTETVDLSAHVSEESIFSSECDAKVWDDYVPGKTPVCLLQYVRLIELSGAGGTGVITQNLIFPSEKFPPQVKKWIALFREHKKYPHLDQAAEEVREELLVFTKNWCRPFAMPCQVVDTLILFNGGDASTNHLEVTLDNVALVE